MVQTKSIVFLVLSAFFCCWMIFRAVSNSPSAEPGTKIKLTKEQAYFFEKAPFLGGIKTKTIVFGPDEKTDCPSWRKVYKEINKEISRYSAQITYFPLVSKAWSYEGVAKETKEIEALFVKECQLGCVYSSEERAIYTTGKNVSPQGMVIEINRILANLNSWGLL